MQLRSLGASSAEIVTTLLWDGRYLLITAVLAGFGRAIAELEVLVLSSLVWCSTQAKVRVALGATCDGNAVVRNANVLQMMAILIFTRSCVTVVSP
jgi:tungstate transport system permease protein